MTAMSFATTSLGRLSGTLASMLVAASASAQQAAALPESAHSSIEYPSPGAAYRALRADPGVQFRTQDGWVIADDPAHHTVWTFSPQGDAAFPAVVKRHLVERGGQLVLETGVLCGASKQVCDDFVRRFVALNDELARAIKARTEGASTPAQ